MADAFKQPTANPDELTCTVKAKWFQPGDNVWASAKTQDYKANGKFSDAETILNKAANDFDPNDGRLPIR